MQGPHHVAQNSTTYVFPGSSCLTASPLSHRETARGGAGSPIFNVDVVFSGANNAIVDERFRACIDEQNRFVSLSNRSRKSA